MLRSSEAKNALETHMKRMALVWPMQRASKVDVARESIAVWMVSESLVIRYEKTVWRVTPLSHACATFFVEFCTTINPHPIEQERCSNCLKMQEVLLFTF